ncbi:hypothetical protein BJ138DRAFT_1180842, partial [Hygrophoropsis aurantiaca]
MDDFYDYKEARAEIDKQATARNKDTKKKLYQLCVWDDGLASKCKTRTSMPSRTTRFVSVDAATKEIEEAVFTLQGVLVDTDLPPLASRPRQATNHIMRAARNPHLTCLGQSSFGDAVSNLYMLHTVLSRNAPPGAMEKWRPTEYKGLVSLDIQNRYFTLRKFTDGSDKINFDELCDPEGYLEDANGHDLVHTEDNRVEYYASASPGAQLVSPGTFRAGDIVEAGLSVAMTPVSHDKYKMLLILRSLALIQSTFTMVITPGICCQPVKITKPFGADDDNQNLTILHKYT